MAVPIAGCSDDSQGDEQSSHRVVVEAVNGFIGGPGRIDTGGLFTEPSDVTVWGGGAPGPADDKIFVVEADEGRSARVQRLDGQGNFELAWGRDVVSAGRAGDTGDSPEICREAPSCKPAPPGEEAGAFDRPTAVDVNQDTGHVYVADSGNLRVQEFTAGGEFVAAWGWGVTSGKARFEICRSKCRAGRRNGPEGGINPGQLAPIRTGGIAVHPSTGDVLVSDGGNRRVLQFRADGRFIRAWGAGVATGAKRLETCTGASGCRRTRPGNPRWVAPGWPRQIAVDDDGVVYASDDQERSRLVRFDVDEASSDAGAALMPPLGSGQRPSGDDTMGFEIDATSGNLVAAWNKFGPGIMGVVTNPGGAAPKRRWIDLGGFVKSMTGIGISPTTGIVYGAKSDRLYPVDPGSTFENCPLDGGGWRVCHGLIVFADRGRPSAKLGSVTRTGDTEATLEGTVTSEGAVSYVFQTSTRDGRWTDVSRPGYLTNADTRPVRATARRLSPGMSYRVRLRVTRLTGDAVTEDVHAGPEALDAAP